jgi:hypothetical protein
LRPSELEFRSENVKPTPLIFDPQHRNIAALIALMAAILFGLGAGWLAGGLITGAVNTDLSNAASQTVQANQNTPADDKAQADSNADDVAAPESRTAESLAQSQAVEPQAESAAPALEEREERFDRRASESRFTGASTARRSVYVAPRGESIPVKVIKGKPLKKVARQFKRLKVW